MTRSSRKPAETVAPEPLTPLVMTARLWKGVFPYGTDGKALKLAVVDADGHVVDQGEAVSSAAWDAVLSEYFKHLQEIGAMRVHEHPPGRH